MQRPSRYTLFIRRAGDGIVATTIIEDSKVNVEPAVATLAIVLLPPPVLRGRAGVGVPLAAVSSVVQIRVA
jgi:hypothetical protein